MTDQPTYADLDCQVKKGNQYHFGMKLHVGVDAETDVAHTKVTNPANIHDVTQARNLLHGGKKQVWEDAGYTGVEKRRLLTRGGLEEWAEQRKASVRARNLPRPDREWNTPSCTRSGILAMPV